MREEFSQYRHIYIVGFGVSGFACAEFFAKRNLDFSLIDSEAHPERLGDFQSAFVNAAFFTAETAAGSGFSADDLLVVSPGVARDLKVIQAAEMSGAKISSDIEIFRRIVDTPMIAVTGSNGKSTVVSLITDIILAAGFRAELLGNIGTPALSRVEEAGKADFVVMELSSFQLESLSHLNAFVATVLNITPDHLDRHKTLGAYRKAKLAVYEGAEYRVVNDADALTFPEKPEGKTGQQVSYGLTEASDFYLHKERIFFQSKPVLSVSDIRIKGQHNLLNVMAAMACCYCAGISIEQMQAGIQRFEGIRHRCQWVDTIQGVSFFNDSKATNVGACLAALEGLSTGKNILLIAGGQDKNGDFSVLESALAKYVKYVVLIGRDAERIAPYIAGEFDYRDSLPEAVVAAFDKALPGDIVLLSPSFASFDMFDNFMHRGDVFIEAVEALAGATA